MRFEFRIIEGPNTDWRFNVRPCSEFSVGRTEVSDMAIGNDSRLSSKHFQLETTDKVCQIADLGSTNGTFVNGTRVQSLVLASGDTIRAGDTVIEFKAIGEPQTPPSNDASQVASTGDAVVSQSNAAPVPPSSTDSASPSVESEQRKSLPIATEGQNELIQPLVAQVEIHHPNGVSVVSIPSGVTTVFGRTEHADVTIADTMISSLHFSLTCENDSLTLRDLGSRNGTTVNGKSTMAAIVQIGQRFKAGSTEFVFVGLRQTTEPVVQPSDRQQSAKETLALPTFQLPENQAWPFAQGLSDEDVCVRIAALVAAICQRQSWVLDRCRVSAANVNSENFHEAMVLAALGSEQDLPLFQRLLLERDLGPARFRLASILGSPRLIPLLISMIESADQTDAYHAGVAFLRMTGEDIDSERIGEVDDVDADEPLEAYLPDPALAKAAWQQLSPQLGSAKRIANGIVVELMNDESQGVGNDESTDAIDMESLLLRQIRNVFTGLEKPTSNLLFLCQDFLSRR